MLALVAIKDRDRHAPGALARDAPVGPALKHAADALAPPRRDPLHLVDGFERAEAQLVFFHRDEPLLGGAEDHRALAAPAVRVAVRELVFLEQRVTVVELLEDRRVGLEDALALKVARLSGEPPLVVDR